MTLTSLHAYENDREEDWNTCGQAAIATMLDFHHVDPFNLPRIGSYWDDGAIIDAIKNDGQGPDVIFGWGTSPGRIAEALRKYGLTAYDVSSSLLNSYGARTRSELFQNLANVLARDLPVPVLVDIAQLGGPAFLAHWPVAYKIANGRVFLANCSWNPSPDIATFISAWHTWYLPMGFNWAAVYAEPSGAKRWSDRDSGSFGTSDPADIIDYTIERSVLPSDSVQFFLQLMGNVTWKKVLNLPDGLGNSWDIVVEGAGDTDGNGLWANQIYNGQELTFSKATFLGAVAPVLRIGDLGGLRGGDKVTFRWVSDTSAGSVLPSTIQGNWRWCNKCQGLFFGDGQAGSRCPAGGTHASPTESGSGNYSLPHNVPPSPYLQQDWRWCNKCQGLFVGGGQADSRCPAGGTHASQAESRSGNYSLPHNVPPSSDRQCDWRWCNKCQGLFFGGGQAGSRCPSGGTHASTTESGSGNYCIPHKAA